MQLPVQVQLCIAYFTRRMAGAERSSALFSMEKHRFSVASGCLACLGSILGKVAFDGETAFHLLAKSSCRHHLPDWVPCNMVGLAVQATSLVGMLTVNAIMLSTYLKALQTSGSTVAAVTSCAINFLLSGVSGRIVFGEHLPVLWFGGASLLVCGLLLVVDSSDTNTLGEASRTTGDSKRPKKSAGSSTNIKRD